MDKTDTIVTLQNCSDEQLCALAARGDTAAESELVSRYGRLVRVCARPLFLAGGDSEDLIQEGMLGLLAAIRGFQPRRDTSFRTYAEVCVRNRMLSAIRSAQGGKHAPLNQSIPIDSPLYYEAAAHLHPSAESPEDLIVGKEEQKERLDQLRKHLSEFEAKILPLYLNGLTCCEIAQKTDRSQKSVDNAIQRIRRKVERLFSSGVSSES